MSHFRAVTLEEETDKSGIMNFFLEKWANAAYTSFGFFWMALWAFAIGYLISSLIQVLVTEKRMQQTMGQEETKSVILGTFFGFISSSCSFAALATTKSLFRKGASFISSLAFLLASTNLVIELGIIISVFLGWQFVVGEYTGGILLIIICWILVRIINPERLIKDARQKLESSQSDNMEPSPDKSIAEKLQQAESWAKISRQYGMEWKMVWKDVSIGFTVAGIVATFIPDSFFESLFINSGPDVTHYTFFELLQHTIVGPVAAFMTFIGSMGNIPLAAILFGKGISFAGVMAFIFSDLVVFPVLRINAKYYGWKMSLFILFLLFSSLIITSLTLHYGFTLLDLLPNPSQVTIQEMDYFTLDYTFYLNVIFLIVSGYLLWFGFVKKKDVNYMKEMADKGKVLEMILKYIAFACYLWLAGGLMIKWLI